VNHKGAVLPVFRQGGFLFALLCDLPFLYEYTQVCVWGKTEEESSVSIRLAPKGAKKSPAPGGTEV
jgi:hypothetical protein